MQEASHVCFAWVFIRRYEYCGDNAENMGLSGDDTWKGLSKNGEIQVQSMTQTISEKLCSMINEFGTDYVSENKIQDSEIHEINGRGF